jgi:uncharacterized damage-inducible protein DinB
MKRSFTAEFIDQSIHRLQENTPKIQKCLHELTEQEVWQRPNSSSNSMGNIVIHLCGNITQYILSSLGHTRDIRERDKEFSAEGGYTKAELFEKLNTTVTDAASVIRNLKDEEMLNVRSVQGHDLSAIGIIVHVVEHYSYHTGQIIFWTKLIKDKDLGFYSNADLNKRNKI